MELWLDSCDQQMIATANRLGIIYGVTTNPTLLAAAREDLNTLIQKLLDIQDGPLAVQVTGDTASEMIKQGIALHTFSERIIVKVPVIQEGFKAMRALAQEEVSVMATAVFHPNQALIAALAGAAYVAPYISRMNDAGIDAFAALEAMIKIFANYQLTTKILAAALRTTDQITPCATLGVQAVTLKGTLFSQFIADDPATLKCVKSFGEDWEASNHQAHSLLAL